jgi:hypothetical protein
MGETLLEATDSFAVLAQRRAARLTSHFGRVEPTTVVSDVTP